jgi:hypothetical protein
LEFAAVVVKKEFSMKTRHGLFFGFAVPAMVATVMLAGLAACRTTLESDFKVTSEGDGCVITGYTGPGGDVIIPAEIQGLPVRVIGDYAFEDCTSLVSVTIPDSVTRIGNGAFFCCINLASVTIPDSVTRIGNGAFFCCKSLASVTIPDSVTRIGDSAFRMSGLTSVIIPDSVTFIGENAFSECTGLENVTISLVTKREWNDSGQFAGCKLSLAAQQALKDAGYPRSF